MGERDGATRETREPSDERDAMKEPHLSRKRLTVLEALGPMCIDTFDRGQQHDAEYY